MWLRIPVLLSLLVTLLFASCVDSADAIRKAPTITSAGNVRTAKLCRDTVVVTSTALGHGTSAKVVPICRDTIVVDTTGACG